MIAVTPRCKDSVPKILNKYSQKWNLVAPVPIATLIFLWAIYIFPQSVCLFCCRKIGGPMVGRYKSLTKTWMFKLGLRTVSFLGAHKSDFLCSAASRKSYLRDHPTLYLWWEPYSMFFHIFKTKNALSLPVRKEDHGEGLVQRYPHPVLNHPIM